MRHIPVEDPPLPLQLPRTPPSHQNSSPRRAQIPPLRSDYGTNFWLRFSPCLGRIPNVNCQGHNVYSYSHPCLPSLYRYPNILSINDLMNASDLGNACEPLLFASIFYLSRRTHTHTFHLSGGRDGGYSEQTNELDMKAGTSRAKQEHVQ